MNLATSKATQRLALVTCSAYPDLDIDDQLLIEPLRALDIPVTIAVWNDPSVKWDQFALALIRSTWDYTRHHADFLAWAKRVEQVSVLVNPLPVIAWSSVKTYLRELERSGVPIVPTTFIEPGQHWTFPDGQFVVKPAISAGSRDTLRLSSANTAAGDRAVTAMHLRRQTAMIQPYFHSVDVGAETALIFLEGEFSHAIRKSALLPLDVASQVFERGLFLQEKITRCSARADQLSVAHAALRCAPAGWLYARVDLIDDPTGNPVVLELEMVEPSLYLGFVDSPGPTPAQTLASHLAQRLQSERQ
ncbi:MAG: hypothetical protein Q7K25_08785 [Actinomycetota bacterium]|nr:hypothetical protein [Actinomycetota bacterium]